MEKPFPGKLVQPDEDKLILIGTLSKPQGLKGGVRMWPQFNDPEDFEELKTDRFFAKTTPSKASLRPKPAAFYELTLKEFDYHQRFLVLFFEGIDNPDSVEPLRDVELYVYEDELWDLPEGQYYTFELVGLDLVDEASGQPVGKVIEMQSGVQDFLVVQPGDPAAKQFLVPYVPEIVLHVDKSKGHIRVNLPEGIQDI